MPATATVSPQVWVIIPAYNGMRWMRDCLTSVLRSGYPCFTVLVVDNASTDGTAGFINSFYPEVSLLRQVRNLGFARGCNEGIRAALKRGAQYVVILNQDTIVDPGWLSALVEAAEQNPAAGIISPMQWDYHGKSLDPTFRWAFPKTAFAGGFIPADHVVGAAMLIRGSLIREIGDFDPFYFCYQEELDLCRRARVNGYRVGLAPKSRIRHWNSLVNKKRKTVREKMLFARNKFYYILKNPGLPLIRNLAAFFLYRPLNSLTILAFPHVILFAVLARRRDRQNITPIRRRYG